MCRQFKLPGLVPGTCTAFHYHQVILNEVHTCVAFIFPCAAWLNASLSSMRSVWFSGSTSPPKRSYCLSSTHEEPTYKSLVNNFDLPCFRWFTLCLLFLLRDPWKLNTDLADAWLTWCSIRSLDRSPDTQCMAVALSTGLGPCTNPSFTPHQLHNLKFSVPHFVC